MCSFHFELLILSGFQRTGLEIVPSLGGCRGRCDRTQCSEHSFSLDEPFSCGTIRLLLFFWPFFTTCSLYHCQADVQRIHFLIQLIEKSTIVLRERSFLKTLIFFLFLFLAAGSDQWLQCGIWGMRAILVLLSSHLSPLRLQWEAYIHSDVTSGSCGHSHQILLWF